MIIWLTLSTSAYANTIYAPAPSAAYPSPSYGQSNIQPNTYPTPDYFYNQSFTPSAAPFHHPSTSSSPPTSEAAFGHCPPGHPLPPFHLLVASELRRSVLHPHSHFVRLLVDFAAPRPPPANDGHRPRARVGLHGRVPHARGRARRARRHPRARVCRVGALGVEGGCCGEDSDGGEEGS